MPRRSDSAGQAAEDQAPGGMRPGATAEGGKERESQREGTKIAARVAEAEGAKAARTEGRGGREHRTREGNRTLRGLPTLSGLSPAPQQRGGKRRRKVTAWQCNQEGGKGKGKKPAVSVSGATSPQRQRRPTELLTEEYRVRDVVMDRIAEFIDKAIGPGGQWIDCFATASTAQFPRWLPKAEAEDWSAAGREGFRLWANPPYSRWNDYAKLVVEANAENVCCCLTGGRSASPPCWIGGC